MAAPQRRDPVFQPIEEEMERSYIDYAMSVIVGRALPEARDGLKPVQRRILYAMNDLNMRSSGPTKKSARVVGECFVKGTLVATERGLLPIEEVRKGDVVFTEGDVGAVEELYEMPSRPLLRVELENGLSVTATKSQGFRVVNEDLSFSWKPANRLRPGDWVVLRSSYPPLLSSLPRLGSFGGREKRLNENLAYLLGQLLSYGWVAHEGKRKRLGFSSADRSVMRRVQRILLEEFSYEATVEVKRFGPNYKPLYVVRVNRDEVNKYFIETFGLQGARASTKEIPDTILRAPSAVIHQFLSGLIDGDGCIAARRRVIHYGSMSTRLIDRLQVLLHHLGYHPQRYATEPVSKPHTILGRRVISRHPFHYLEVTGEEAWRLARRLDLANHAKRGRALRMPQPSRPMQQHAGLIPFGSRAVFTELSEAHLGAGWFADITGAKFRSGITYPSGGKIRYSAQLHDTPLHLDQMTQWGLLRKLERIGPPLAFRFKLIDSTNLTFARVRAVEPGEPQPTYDLGIRGEHNFTANGLVVHNCLGKYHPHGDMAVYDALVRMAQDFSLRYPLVDGQGNFGSVDGDPPAAQRYTECRLSPIAEEMLQDIDRETVNFADNFDATLKEPELLPGKFPNLLVNGSSGIAVGMATNIPPHNLREIVDGLVHLLENPEANLLELMQFVKGPDFPTGGIIFGAQGILEAYQTGKGLIQVRARTKLEEMSGDKSAIIVNEIPYQVNKSALIESIAELVKAKRIEGITDLRDESDREGMRIVIELRRDASDDIVLNQLFHHTQMQATFSIINLALVEGEPQTLSLKETMEKYIAFREEVVRRRTLYDLGKARARLHIVQGLLVALDHLDAVIALIRRSRTAEEARVGIMGSHSLSEEQAKAILDMRLSKLTALEGQALRDESQALGASIRDHEDILASRGKIRAIIKGELEEIKAKYGDDRRTTIQETGEEVEIEDLIPDEEIVVTITNTGYIKRQPLNVYRVQRRAGIGLIGMETKEEDYVVDLYVTRTHNYILFFTNRGRVHWLKAWRIPLGTRQARGKPIVNLLPHLEPEEGISAMVPVDSFDVHRCLIFATRRGVVKKTLLDEYSNPRVTGIWAIKLREGDELVDVKLCDGGKDIILATHQGKAARFDEANVRPMGRYTTGVRGVRLREGDSVVSMTVVVPGSHLLTVTENGYGKLSDVEEYRKTRRGAQGVITIKTTERNGAVVAVREVNYGEELIITSVNGMIIRFPVDDLRVMGRNTQGVRIMKLREGDRVKAVAKLVKENGNGSTPEAPGGGPPGPLVQVDPPAGPPDYLKP